MKHLLGSIALCTILFGAVSVTAHKAKDSGPVTALHGGQALTAGPYHLELVATDGELTLYVTDHSDKGIPTDGARAKATIQHGTENSRHLRWSWNPLERTCCKGAGTFYDQSGYRNHCLHQAAGTGCPRRSLHTTPDHNSIRSHRRKATPSQATGALTEHRLEAG
ncbi:MAG: hypothetical protein HC801_13835 [Nitrospira sp.]|nr:hypothetical protein [Nitrospira sp.]